MECYNQTAKHSTIEAKLLLVYAVWFVEYLIRFRYPVTLSKTGDSRTARSHHDYNRKTTRGLYNNYKDDWTTFSHPDVFDNIRWI